MDLQDLKVYRSVKMDPLRDLWLHHRDLWEVKMDIRPMDLRVRRQRLVQLPQIQQRLAFKDHHRHLYRRFNRDLWVHQVHC